MEGRNDLTTAQFKTMLTLHTSVSILEEIDRRRGKMLRSEFSRAIYEAGLLLLSDQEKIIVMTSAVSSGSQATNQNPQTATTTEAVKSQQPQPGRLKL